MSKNESILIAPLNWGLGHATRCIPLIEKYLKEGHQVILASDGEALKLLIKEFPSLPAEKLPGYKIRYPKKALLMPLWILAQSLGIGKSIVKEKKVTEALVSKYKLTKIISDNRYGVRSKQVPSVFITHQLRVLSGIFSPVSSYIQKKMLQAFDEIWVPDYSGKPNLSGKLSHDIQLDIPVKYLGPLSRFNIREVSQKIDILVLLSGPEPQRSLLEKILIRLLKQTNYKVLLVEGKIENEKKITRKKNIRIINFLLKDELEQKMQEAKLIISRSGYTSIMDFQHLKRKVLFIPTPGQYEQEYLAKYQMDTRQIPYIPQNKLDMLLLKNIETLLSD